MTKQTLRDAAVQKSLMLSEQEALKVLIFMAGMEAQRVIESETDMKNESARQPHLPPAEHSGS